MNAFIRSRIGGAALVWVVGLFGPVGLLGIARVEAATIYVSPAGNDANDGLTWPTAKRTVQAGLNRATAGDQVWVAAGTYVENITLTLGVELYGGFAGTETDMTQRNRTVNVTILDGNQAGSVVTGPPGSTLTTRIDGFTIRNGDSNTTGGGIYFNPSSPSYLSVAFNTITGNSALDKGGGIYFGGAGEGSIFGNTITGNRALDKGGGICCNNASPTIANNNIIGNMAAGISGGGGISCLMSSSPTIASNTITGNSALGAGGICCDGSSRPTIASNVIAGNSVSGGGGGISCLMSSSPTIANNTITTNSASYGGGIWCASSASSTIVNTIIAFNSSGIRRESAAPSLRSNCVYGNTASNYSGLTDPTGTNGNISIDPELAGVIYGNLHIQPDSPCRNAGDDSVVQPSWRDVDLEARIQGTHVDIGADESNGTPWARGPYAIVRVSPAGNDANNGSSWALAKRTVQAALDAAAASSGEVWVQEGVYKQLITLRSYMHVYGGFAGTETQRSERNWLSHPTVLDGYQQIGSVVTARAGYRTSTIDGFTIRNGYGTPAGSSRFGGGIFCDLSSPTIADCTITGNSVSLDGGGVYCKYASSPIIVNSILVGNSAGGSGGGIYCPSSATIVNSTITGNSAAAGGGIHCGTSATIVNTIVAFNSSGIHGSGAPLLRYNCVYANTAYDYSGLTDPTNTDGNRSADPRFVRPASPGPDSTWGTADDDYGDLQLLPGSPCIDGGDNAYVPADPADINGDGDTTVLPFDLAGKPRFADDPATTDTGAGSPPIVDIGAYEYSLLSRVHVATGGNDANDGLFWATAKRTIRAALDATVAGDQVWVAAGTYVENITLRFGVGLYGGFTGGETDLTQRNWKANVTILDGNQADSVVKAPSGATKSTRIDGFVIRNGKAASGGGIYCNNASPTIANNSIIGNMAAGISGYGSGGGIYCSGSSPTIANNTITGNTATSTTGYGYGGGIYCYASSATIVNNTIAANIAAGSTAFGGGILCVISSATIANTLITFNSSGIGKLGPSTLSLRYNCVYGNTAYNYSGLTDPTGTNGNISADPRFVRPASPGPDGTWGTADDDYGDLRLLPGSPCIDAGSNADVPADAADLDGDGDTTEPLPFDLAGAKRFLDVPASPNTGAGTPPIVDMGAYEAHRPGDVDGDGDVDVFDIIAVVNAFGCVPGYPNWNAAADFDGNGIVDVFDVIAVVTNFGAGT